jgi:hypothetical protein
MIYVAHRINTIQELKNVPKRFGVEIDLRDHHETIILQHDPFKDGESFEEYLKHYTHKLLILNVKSERIELKIIELLKKYNIKNYFFLDSSFPMIYLLSQQGEKNLAIRFSEFEGLDTVLAVKDRVSWVWVDCFTKLPLSKEIFAKLKASGLKLCLVSPELQGRDEDIETYRKFLQQENLHVDAICTKKYNIPRWELK